MGIDIEEERVQTLLQPGAGVGKSPEDGRRAVVVFDGVCNLCNGLVRWLIRRDPEARLGFVSLQSPRADRLLREAGAADLADADSLVVLDGAGTHTRSGAVLRVAHHLGFPWSLAGAARVVPQALRDALYDVVARNRYRWFGRRAVCPVPSAEQAARFLDAEVPADCDPAPGGDGGPPAGAVREPDARA